MNEKIKIALENHEIDLYGDDITTYYIKANGNEYRLEKVIRGAYDTETGEELGGICATVSLYETTWNNGEMIEKIYNELDELGTYELFLDAETVYNCSPEIRRFIDVTSWGCWGDDEEIKNKIIEIMSR